MLVLSVTKGFMATRNLGVFVSSESGQDLVEYSLLIAFVALAGAAMFIGMSGSVNTIWSAANSKLAAANSGS
jgi:Flp pilus assembly pilin Flp